MILIPEKYSQQQLSELGDEFYDLLFAKKLTQSKYEEILNIMIANRVMPEVLAGMVAQVPREWRSQENQFSLSTSA